jgi:hypothetical protein
MQQFLMWAVKPRDAAGWLDLQHTCASGKLHVHGPAGTFEGEPIFTPSDAGGKLLDVRFEVSDLLWPWSGYLALYLRVKADGAKFEGAASGEVCMHV